MKQKPLSLLCLTLTLILTLCLAQSAFAADQYKVWMPPFGTEDALDKEFWETELKPFAQEKGIDIVVEITPWAGYEEKYLTGISSGSGPDVGYMYVEMVNDFINMGALLPLDDYLIEEDFDHYFYLKNGEFQGKIYMFPIIVGNPRMVVFNMEILRNSGIEAAPKTWDEFVEAGLKVKETQPDIYPFLQNWGDTNTGSLNSIFFPYLWQAGGVIFNDDYSELTLDSPECVAGAQFLYDLRFTHGIMPELVTSLTGADAQNMFLEGKVAMFDGSSSFVNSRVIPAGIDWDYAILKGEKQATFVALDCLVLPSNTKDPDIGMEIVRFMTSGPVMTKFHREMSMFPPVARDEEYQDLAEFKVMYEDPNIEFNNYPAVAGMFKVNDMLYKNMQLLMLDQMTPEEVMRSVVDYYNTAVK